MVGPGGGTGSVSGAGALVVCRDDVAQQRGSVAAAAATRLVDAVPAVFVVSFSDRALMKVGGVGCSTTCHSDIHQCTSGAFAENSMGAVGGDTLGGVHGDGVAVVDVLAQILASEDGAGVVIEAAGGDAVA